MKRLSINAVHLACDGYAASAASLRRLSTTLTPRASLARNITVRGIFLSILLAVACLAQSAVLLDRVAVIVGNRVIKTSDVDLAIRAAAFLNGSALDLSLQAKKEAADRLVDQEIIRKAFESGDYSLPSSQEVDAFIRGVVKQRFRSDAEYAEALSRYGLTDSQMRTVLAWQLTVLRFIDERFRPGVFVSDQDVAEYYQQHKTELEGQNPGLSTLDELTPKIRETLEGERINQQFFSWLADQRKQQHIEYREGAFQS